jgi:PPOX class probable F420-dependent enzyme
VADGTLAPVPEHTLPPRLVAFLSRPNAAVIATLRPDGAPVTVATWYDWEDGRVLVNMDESRKRLAHLRSDPRVSLTIMDVGSWSAHVSLQGHVVSLEDDPELRDIDRLSRRYTGAPYPIRDHARVSAWIEIERWHAWHSERL